MPGTPSGEEDDAARRQREMNLFAAMASGGSFVDTSTRTSSQSRQLQQQQASDSSAAMFADAAAAVENTGTFAMSKSTDAHADAASSNLEAAAAALTGDKPRSVLTKEESATFCPDVFNVVGPKPKPSPMQIEEVLMPRPLFFGPVIPPRVLRETRKAVTKVVEEKGIDAVNMTLDCLPPELRNIVGTIEAFGFGQSVFPGTYPDDENSDEYWRGNPYISSYHPVWGDDARAERRARQKLRNRAEQPDSHTRGGYAAGETTVEFGSPATTAGQATSDEAQGSFDRYEAKTPAISNRSKHRSENDKTHEQNFFGMLARGEGMPGEQSPTMVAPKQEDSPDAVDVAREDMDNKPFATANFEKNLFSQLARGEDDDLMDKVAAGGSFVPVASDAPASGFPERSFGGASHTLIVHDANDEDDSSVVDDELKKQVGINDNLNAALASLSDSGPSGVTSDAPGGSITEEESHSILSQLSPTTPGGRPFSNMELTNGRVPLYACDDSPLPVEADLGIFEIKEDQLRSAERKKSQDIIAKHAVPNIFGAIACPNPALSPDDLQSWNSRTAPIRRRLIGGHQGNGAFGNPKSPQRKDSVELQTPLTEKGKRSTPKPAKKKRTKSQGSIATGDSPGDSKASSRKTSGQNPKPLFDDNTRFGWWNVLNDGITPCMTELDSQQVDQMSPQSTIRKGERFPLQLPPADHSSFNIHPDTRLSPSPSELREENLPLSRLHAATATAEALPFLSDRPPSYRYVQIDANAVRFPNVGKTMEPLFCTLAVYHVETMPTSGSNPRAAPVPNLQRCGRVTELLSFDVVEDEEVEARCAAALWPYTKEGKTGQNINHSQMPESENTIGTRCGVFPIPSNLSVSNLYAILIVHKVFSDVADIGVYMNGKDSRIPGLRQRNPDYERLSLKIERMSNRHGQVLMPFAFGVAPLLQVIGTDVPTVPGSRGVQIPLFRLVAGLGERPIIDHVMVMLYPRADHDSASVCELTGGKSMLIIRNFGYLGLHSAIHSKSSLARARLVDFTGELQVRRAAASDSASNVPDSSIEKASAGSVVPPWRPQFVAEPTRYGGRSTKFEKTDVKDESLDSDSDDECIGDSQSPLYAQELAVVPLLLAPAVNRPMQLPSQVRVQQNGLVDVNNGDHEPSLWTSFCNEMLCQLRLIRNCAGKNVTIKVEVRSLEWNAERGAFLAFPAPCGPCIHNSRRGPFLVREAFSCCAYKTYNPKFMDEFKVKLPLVLQEKVIGGGENAGGLCLLFSVYNIRLRSRKKWRRRSRTGGVSSRIGVVGNDEDDEDCTGSGFELLGCGFLPLSSEMDALCLIENGLHDVTLSYTAKLPNDSDGLPPNTLLLNRMRQAAGECADMSSTGQTVSSYGTPDVANGNAADGVDDSSSVSDSIISETTGIDSMPRNTDSFAATERMSPRLTSAKAVSQSSKSDLEDMTLQVRIVIHSTVHPQNPALNSFLRLSPGAPSSLTEDLVSASYSPWRMHREELLLRIHFMDSRSTDEKEENLLPSVVQLSRLSVCPASDRRALLLRALPQLWRIVVTGSGKPSLIWANPASHSPLRLHSFVSLLHMITSVSKFMTTNGVSQLDGKGEWNLVVMARVVAMLFDENSMFSLFDEIYGEECFDPNEWPPSSSRVSEKKKEGVTSRENINSEVHEKHASRSGAGRKKHTRSPNVWISTIDGKSKVESLSLDSIDASHFGERETRIPSINLDNVNASDDYSSLRQKSMTLPSSVATHATTHVALHRPEVSGSQSNEESRIRVDSKSDFQSALSKAASMSSQDGFVSNRPPSGAPRTSGTQVALEMIDAYGGGTTTDNSKRRWMTAPSSSLATIREDFDSRSPAEKQLGGSLVMGGDTNSFGGKNDRVGDSLDTELVLHDTKRAPKQFRVPKRRVDNVDSNTYPKTASNAKPNASLLSLPTTDDEVEAASAAFLDTVCKNLGYGSLPSNENDEQKRVGHAHHRKTRSRSSIDWALPSADTLIEKQQELVIGSGTVGGAQVKARSPDNIEKLSKADGMKHSPGKGLPETGTDACSMSSLEEEERITVPLPSFVDRLVRLGQKKGKGRWFPYVYEVIIFQWTALLSEQKKIGKKAENGSSSVGSGTTIESIPLSDGSSNRTLMVAASRARGVSVVCAPVLFETIKKSLGGRLQALLRRLEKNGGNPQYSSLLATLDDALFNALEQLICMITDACLDCRNFDSFEFRQISVHVNDSIVRFLRDMFAYLDTRSAHRLVMVYFSRFVTKNGKNWKERDSKVGLKSTWEICKLRLNAITAFVRFPDFVRVCSPQLNSWASWPITAPANTTRDFFSKTLSQFNQFALPGFAASEIPTSDSSIEIPAMKHWWLAVLVGDICLSGTEHVDQSIRHRASSLLHELFWSLSQEGKASGTSSELATMYIPLLVKMLSHISYMSSFAPKHQLRMDIIPCMVFVIEFAPAGLLRALWRKLCVQAGGKGGHEKYGGMGGVHVSSVAGEDAQSNDTFTNGTDSDREGHDPDIFDMFSLLNLALSTFEYEGCDANVEAENDADANDQRAVWTREFLPAQEHDGYSMPVPKVSALIMGRESEKKDENVPAFSTSSSRKWHAHDGSVVIINTAHQIVREMLAMLQPSAEPSNSSISSGQFAHQRAEDQVENPCEVESNNSILRFSLADTVIFVRAVTSLYLHCLALNQSDIVITKTLDASVEVVKIFGIKIFLEAVGETLQHWMRVVSLHCGARRAGVRIQASEFLALILRLTWDTYGSFYRIKLPLIAVQTEVMERIVATAAFRFYREQRKAGTVIQSLSNDCAEACVSPLWRTLDRLHHQPASQNVAFRSALIRLAEKMKKLFQAYIAAHALGILTRARSPLSPMYLAIGPRDARNQANSILSQKSRISVHRIISASAGFSKQFLGLHASSTHRDTVAHNEAVEDAFLAAADVFSPTELPSHRVAWLRRLADFHASRAKFAEEATCRYHIHMTFRQAARLHDSLWSTVPFLPWTNGDTHIGGEGPAGEAGDYYDAEEDLMEDLSADDYGMLNLESLKQNEISHSFRRIFYRVASSVRMRTGDWEIGGNKNLFYGVAFPSEYRTVTPWISLREVEEGMVEEAETAGDLYLKAGIVESSRYAWSLATQFYSETFNYAKLAYVYKRLAIVVASQIPVVDTNNQLELSSPLGRFYRVWFHGGAPDELSGTEFVYRTSGSVKLEQFGSELKEVVRSILPETTPIDIFLDDGRPEESSHRKKSARRPLGGPIEPVRIKVTPLRPLLKGANTIRGTPEWFCRYADMSFDGSSAPPSTQHFGSGGSVRHPFPRSESATNVRHTSTSSSAPGHRARSRSFNTSVFTSGSMSAGGRSFRSTGSEVASKLRDELYEKNMGYGGSEMIGVDAFSFLQPIDKDRHRATRDWLRAQAGSTAEKSLRVTQLQVEQTFPACVARQKVVHRTVFTQSPLEAGIDAVSSWCAVLFRTGVATNGLAVLGGNQSEQGIGTAAAKVVADCIHSSRVKEISTSLLSCDYDGDGENAAAAGTMIMTYTKLGQEEWKMLQKKLARAIVIFLELLHLLIARNRNLLLAVVDARKRRDGGSSVGGNLSRSGGLAAREGRPATTSSPDSAGRRFGGFAQSFRSGRSSSFNDGMTASYDGNNHHDDDKPSMSNMSLGGSANGPDKTDSAIAIQSELQRAYISIARTLYPNISRVLKSETPRWLKSCCQESYFSTASFRQTRLPMGEELFFFGGNVQDSSHKSYHHDRDVPVAIVSSFSPKDENETTASANDGRYRNDSFAASSIITDIGNAKYQQTQFVPQHHQKYQSL